VKPVTLLVFLAALLRPPFADAFEFVDVYVGDLAGLRLAINEANDRSTDIVTRIYVNGEISLSAADTLPPIKARTNVIGAAFRTLEGGPDRLFYVEPTGILSVGASNFVNWSQATEGPILFENHGTLLLINVLFDSVFGYAACSQAGCTPNETAVIQNATSGDLTLDQVLVVDENFDGPGNSGPDNRFLANEGLARFVRSQFYLSPRREKEPIFNGGSIRMRNVSFMVRNPIDVPTLALLTATEDATARVTNSVFDGFTGGWCKLVRSDGHNTSTASECSWSNRGDVVGSPTGLIWRSRYPDDPDNNYFDLVTSAASPLVDTADATWCPPGYTIWDGDDDGVATCDRGFWELTPTSVAEGGINGFYYNPDEDGHYVYVQETDFTTLVMWNTFDADGNQAWIYGTGELASGRSVIAEAYINRTDGLRPDGLITDVEAEPWGLLEVDMKSCTQGLVNYRSVLPEFGVGQFPIARLAYVKQLGCVDPQ
jgi:hypothetical protein